MASVAQRVTILSIFALPLLSFPVQGGKQADTDRVRMEALVRYAETTLLHGRDTYGKEHTPLFVDALEVSTLKAPEMMYVHRLGGPGPRSKQPFQPVISSNLAYQGNLMRFLVGMSNLTGDAKYKAAYMENLRYYFAHYAAPNGLLQMGHHRWVNLNSDHWDGNDWPAGRSGHEMKRDYPYYQIFWESDPVATRRMMTAHWDAHLQDWGFMNFTRHGSYVKELNEETVWSQPITEPIKGIVPGNLTFFDSGSDIIYAGAQLGRLNNDARPLFWAQRLYARYSDSAPAETGLPPWHHTSLRNFGTEEEPVPEYALVNAGSAGFMNNGGVAMLRIGEELGEKGEFYRETMLKHLKAYAKICYRPEVNLMRQYLIDGTDLAERARKNAKPGAPETDPWPGWSPSPVTITAYAICYRQSGDAEIWEALRAMCRGNDLGDIGAPGGKVLDLNLATGQSSYLLIFPLVELFRATKERGYLKLARSVADNAFRKHFRTREALFTPSELHRTANQCSAEPLAYLTLEAALRGKLDEVPSYAGSNEGEAVPYLRPLKSRPYNPTVSHLAYSYSLKAVCDDLLPESSSDREVPHMSWQNVRKATDEAIVTFPDILDGPVIIKGMKDHPESRNSVSAMVIDSPHGYTFTGDLAGTGDLSLTVLRGEHAWAPDSTWTTRAWSSTETYDLIMDVAQGAKLKFQGRAQEVEGAYTWCDGAGIVKKGEGVVELTADYAPIYSPDVRSNRGYRAPTLIQEGLLLVNNESGSGVSPKSRVQVDWGATLGGNGAIGLGGSSAEVVVRSGGTIAPGDGIGTLTLRDGLQLRDGARLIFEVGEKADLLRITGGTFRGSNRGKVVITIKDAGGMKAGRSYDLIDFTGASFVGVEANDFRLDKSQNFQGTFHLVGTRLQFSVFAPRLTPETAPAVPPRPEPVLAPVVAVDREPRRTNFIWTGMHGGSWTDRTRWKGGNIPNSKEPEWVQYQFAKPRRISGVQVYWFVNGRDRKLPERWRVLYHTGKGWQPVESPDEYSLEVDQFNEVNFRPVTTGQLRLEVDLQPGVSAGVQEWRVLP